MHHVARRFRPGRDPGDSERPGTTLLGADLGSIGVVYGDIGTSPLYAFREAVDRGVRPAARSRARPCSACSR